MIHLRNVTRTYSSGNGIVRALDAVSLDIAAGEFVTVSGPSGCGKSTLLNLLGGLDRPTSGEIFVDGLPLHQASKEPRSKLRGIKNMISPNDEKPKQASGYRTHRE